MVISRVTDKKTDDKLCGSTVTSKNLTEVNKCAKNNYKLSVLKSNRLGYQGIDGELLQGTT
jgi:hypothetical protein